MRLDHFAEIHYWNGFEIVCVIDEEDALKRKNNNVNDISWDNNTRSLVVRTPSEFFPGGVEPDPNTHVMFDNRPMKIISVAHNMGVFDITLSAVDPREF
ncbi:MAG: hypothetical protein Q4B09_05350 [Lachnospiraceae bacterium]|nr:hypothetical protein [Lachnospiraceae bacterium]